MTSLFKLYYVGGINKNIFQCLGITSLPSKSFSSSSCYHISFARKLVMGKLNMNWFFPYPVLNNEEEWNDLNNFSCDVAKYFVENVNSAKMDKEGQFDPKVLQGLKCLGLYGQQIPMIYGGLGLSNVKYAHVLEEVSADSAISVMLGAHQDNGAKSILIFGTDEQKQKYLPLLASGEWTAGFALTESNSGSDIASMQTTAQLSKDGRHWVLNGEKSWVVNGAFADVLIVFAKTTIESCDSEGEMLQNVSAFIVERSFGGITTAKQDDKLGIRACNTCSVRFENTPVPVENLFEEPGDGFKLAMDILSHGRLAMGGIVAGQLKRMVNMATKHIYSPTQFGKKLTELDLMKQKLFDMVMKTYAVESMTYMTAGQMDVIEDDEKPQDCSIETAMLKIYSSEASWSCTNECLQVFGRWGYLKDFPLERMLRDSRILLLYQGSNEILRLFVTLSMLQYGGSQYEYKLKLRKSGSLLQQLGTIYEQAVEWYSTQFEEQFVPNKSFGLTTKKTGTMTWLHPSLKRSGQDLEKSVGLFRKRIYDIFVGRGKEIQHDQISLKIIADIAINLFAMSAVIARCNKAKILALRNADHDLQITKAFVLQTYKENILLMQMLSDPYVFDVSKERDFVCEKISNGRKYNCSNPLEVPDNYNEHPGYIKQLNDVAYLK